MVFFQIFVQKIPFPLLPHPTIFSLQEKVKLYYRKQRVTKSTSICCALQAICPSPPLPPSMAQLPQIMIR